VHLAQGLFAAEHTYPVIVRFSTAPGGPAFRPGSRAARHGDQGDRRNRAAGRRRRVRRSRLGRPSPPPQIETLAAANNHILGETFHSVAALRYGDYVAKLSAAPRSTNVRALTGRPVDRKAGASALRDLVVATPTTCSAYPRSSEFRHAFNGIEQHEPAGIDELPA
jgi:hypothetical protein